MKNNGRKIIQFFQSQQQQQKTFEGALSRYFSVTFER